MRLLPVSDSLRRVCLLNGEKYKFLLLLEHCPNGWVKKNIAELKEYELFELNLLGSLSLLRLAFNRLPRRCLRN